MSSHVSTPAIVTLADLTWPEVAEFLNQDTIALLPVGAIEAHGPHLPLNTDVVIASEIAIRSARALNDSGTPAIVLPPVQYGVSYVGLCFPGTAPVPPKALTSAITSILTSVAKMGPQRLVVINAHLEPAHVAAIEEAVADASKSSRAFITFPDVRQDRWATTLSAEFRQGARHAGAYETSLMMAAAPDRVREHLLPTLPPVWIDLPAKLRTGATTFIEAGGAKAYFGNPATSTAAEGERLFAALVRMVITTIEEMPSPSGG